MSAEDDDSVLESSDVSSGFYLSKAENELFKDESYKPLPLIQIKRKETKKYGEEWFIFENKEMVIKLESDKLSNAEKDFLRTVEGTLFLLKIYKNGCHSFTKIKKEIKNHVNSIQRVPSKK
jgi:hypothetical protein